MSLDPEMFEARGWKSRGASDYSRRLPLLSTTDLDDFSAWACRAGDLGTHVD